MNALHFKILELPNFLAHNINLSPKKLLLEMGVSFVCKKYSKSHFFYSPAKTVSKLCSDPQRTEESAGLAS